MGVVVAQNGVMGPAPPLRHLPDGTELRTAFKRKVGGPPHGRAPRRTTGGPSTATCASPDRKCGLLDPACQ